MASSRPNTDHPNATPKTSTTIMASASHLTSHAARRQSPWGVLPRSKTDYRTKKKKIAAEQLTQQGQKNRIKPPEQNTLTSHNQTPEHIRANQNKRPELKTRTKDRYTKAGRPGWSPQRTENRTKQKYLKKTQITTQNALKYHAKPKKYLEPNKIHNIQKTKEAENVSKRHKIPQKKKKNTKKNKMWMRCPTYYIS